MNQGGLAIWFWQRIVSPHMAWLAAALAQRGCAVSYVAEQEMTADRARLGWRAPDLGNAVLRIASTDSEAQALVREAHRDSVHICQGIRSNGRIGLVQRALAQRGLKQWVVMETVDDAGVRGVLKRLEYARLFRRWRKVLEGVLATGHSTADWITARGMPIERVFPFAYFLQDQRWPGTRLTRMSGPIRFVFVGQFVEGKRLDLLISALGRLVHQAKFELLVIGSGPLEARLQARAHAVLPGRVRWIGRLLQEDVPGAIAQADCLVLPSRHDGWGAVISESLMVGVPVVCSDACGAAVAVKASGVGGVFAANDESDLVRHLRRAIEIGPIGSANRKQLALWASCLGASAGADYLLQIIAHRQTGGVRPNPPWSINARNYSPSEMWVDAFKSGAIF